MFEVIEIAKLPFRRWFEWYRTERVPVKIKATKAMSCERLGPTFQKNGSSNNDIYRADFSEGEVITIYIPSSAVETISEGDMRSVATLDAEGYLKSYFRRIGRTTSTAGQTSTYRTP